MGFFYTLPIGQFWKQTFGEKERGLLFKSYTILEEWQAYALEPIPSRIPREKPCHPMPTYPRLHPEILLPFKNTVLWETTGDHCMIIQVD